jgi:hypothetical protein
MRWRGWLSRCRARRAGLRCSSWCPSGFGGGFAAPQPSGEIVTDERELLGEVVSVGAVFAELLHADSMLPEWSPVALVEDVA